MNEEDKENKNPNIDEEKVATILKDILDKKSLLIKTITRAIEEEKTELILKNTNK